MTEDARFEDAGGGPLRLRALDAEDLSVIAGLCQDAVFLDTDVRWDRRARRFALLLNRFRWEDRDRASRQGDYERVRTVLSVEDAMRVQSQGVPKGDADMVLSLLSVGFEPGEDGTGTVLLTLAGDGAIRIEVEALEVLLRDVTRPYRAPSGKVPDHGA